MPARACTPTPGIPTLLAADWGTPNVRFFFYDAAGKVIAREHASLGIRNLGVMTYEQVLQSTLQAHGAPPDLPIVLSGMVGARGGWIEAPYVACPATAEQVSRGVITAPVERLRAQIVPGLSTGSDRNGLPGVMRGEETQIIGVSSRYGDGVYVLPGTHSKWVDVCDGEIRTFTSHMTGEMFELLKEHSIIGDLMEGADHDQEAFSRGVSRALAGAPLMPLVFSARTECLSGRLGRQQIASYLSGVLIGSEIYAEMPNLRGDPIVLIGSRELLERYQAAFAQAGVNELFLVAGEEAAATGLWILATSSGLVT
jgi:2-dehydro-3-deoxygalactonokinase